MSCRRLLGFWLILLTFAFAAAGAPITAVIAYGDSLSDDGNLFKATGQPGPPYFQGRASNGPVAVELLAADLGIPLLDYAFGGATTGIGNHLDPGGTATTLGTFGLPGMMPLYLDSIPTITPVASSALFIVWGGPDDLFSPSPLDSTARAVADRAVSNLVTIVNGLKGLGAQHILVPGMTDLGLTPFKLREGPASSAAASALSDYFNARLRASLPSAVIFVDTAALLRTVVADPGAYGFANVTDSCLDSAGTSVCGSPDQYLFWDDIHPSARTHQILAAEFVTAAVPEPSTLGLTACVLVLGAFRLARHRGLLRRRLVGLDTVQPRC
jgi:cholinesterase